MRKAYKYQVGSIGYPADTDAHIEQVTEGVQ